MLKKECENKNIKSEVGSYTKVFNIERSGLDEPS